MLALNSSENAAILESFKQYSTLLDHVYDKHEKIYKCGRDLTRDSKKIIFTLHSLLGCSAEKQEATLDSVASSLLNLRDTIISNMATLLEGEPQNMFTKAYSGGMEEYIEAVQFYAFLKRGMILSYKEMLEIIILTPSIVKDTGSQQNQQKKNTSPSKQPSEDKNREKTEAKKPHEETSRTDNSLNSRAGVLSKESCLTACEDSNFPSVPKTEQSGVFTQSNNASNTVDNNETLPKDVAVANKKETGEPSFAPTEIVQSVNNNNTDEFPNTKTVSSKKDIISIAQKHAAIAAKTDSTSQSVSRNEVSLFGDNDSRLPDVEVLRYRAQLLPHDVFILGLSDVSGELMKYYTKSVASGVESPNVVNFLQAMTIGYKAIGTDITKNLANKVFVHGRNLSKVEKIVYEMKLREQELSSEQMQEYIKIANFFEETDD